MFANLTVGKRLVAGFGLAALTLVAIAAVCYRNASLLIENERLGCALSSGAHGTGRSACRI